MSLKKCPSHSYALSYNRDFRRKEWRQIGIFKVESSDQEKTHFFPAGQNGLRTTIVHGVTILTEVPVLMHDEQATYNRKGRGSGSPCMM